ncbi:MAG TPA: hypothetical protein VMG12_00605 [Polyangiaceae bacterium]|nr:hypothetical protein [Polyangiaceae bacterium]
MSASNPTAAGGQRASAPPPPAAATRIIEECAHGSHAGTLSFGDVVGKLMGAGVESYFADFRHGTTTYYLASGASHAVPLPTPDLGIAEAFDSAAIIRAIRGSQRGEVKYPEFVQRAITSGCIGYFVFIAGRHVRYLGRRGEDHVEHFPQ